MERSGSRTLRLTIGDLLRRCRSLTTSHGARRGGAEDDEGRDVRRRTSDAGLQVLEQPFIAGSLVGVGAYAAALAHPPQRPLYTRPTAWAGRTPQVPRPAPLRVASAHRARANGSAAPRSHTQYAKKASADGTVAVDMDPPLPPVSVRNQRAPTTLPDLANPLKSLMRCAYSMFCAMISSALSRSLTKALRATVSRRAAANSRRAS